MAYGALYTGVTGLRSFERALGVIGDNIANMNTPGFKSGQAQFASLLAQRIGGSGPQANQVGNGTTILGISTDQSQGSFALTQRDTDMAIEGRGYFVLRDSSGRELYTRAGQFGFDQQGRLVDPLGNTVQGYQVGPNGEVSTTIGDIFVKGELGAPKVTSAISLRMNLDASTAATKTFDATDPFTTSDFSTALTTYDSLGQAHNLNAFFVKTANPNEWEVHVLIASDQVTGGTGEYTELTSAGEKITFDSNGALDTEPSFNLGGTPLAISYANGATAGSITIDFGKSITGDGGTGVDGTTQYGSASMVQEITQDGWGPGTPQGFEVEADGTLQGLLSNGETRILGKIALAGFQNPAGLERAGANLLRSSSTSGEAILGSGGSSGLGAIRNFAIEQSNVDLATEFVGMITNQRGFQANARVITTNSDLLNELVNILR